MAELPIYWLHTGINPRTTDRSLDAGRRGWKGHAVRTTGVEPLSTLKRPALCGLVPRHGWDIDLFIPDRPSHWCRRCMRLLPDDYPLSKATVVW